MSLNTGHVRLQREPTLMVSIQALMEDESAGLWQVPFVVEECKERSQKNAIHANIVNFIDR